MISNEHDQNDDSDDVSFEDEPPTQLHLSTPMSPSFFEQTSADEGAFARSAAAKVFDANNLPLEFGNYTLVELIGEGGAGIVFKAKPKAGHTAAKTFDTVAVKLIRPEIMASPKAAQRFEKESRLHSEVDDRFVTRHLEFGCEQGVHFIASEFVDGVGLDEVIGKLRSYPAKQSFRVVADILRALSALHQTGVIHRDVKPANVIASFQSQKREAGELDFTDFEIAKLTDFGLARHIEQSESLAMTRQQTLLGTPLYMSPEQYFESRTVDARADIYSVGVTLYQMISGKPPFESSEASKLAEMHRVERPRPLTLVREGTSEAVNSIVMKALEKEPSLRYQDASEMLADVEKVLNDRPTSLRLYPETPDTFHPSIRNYAFEWTLNASTMRLWPLVTDTDRFNQAIGLPAPKFTYDHSGSERKVFAEANFNGMKVCWREHPFQWILGREMSVLREFTSGPFEWVTSTVELHPLTDSRTRLVHRFQVKPRGLLGKIMTPIQFSIMTKRSLNRVYDRIEQIANDTSCGYACDVSFSKPGKLTDQQKRNLSERSEKLSSAVANRSLVNEFSHLIEAVADPQAARIRPIPLSQKLNCSLDDSLQICLRGVEAGLLNMSWDVICPVCRVSASNVSSISRLQSHSHCEVCNLDFKIEFAKSVEVVFSAHPEIRSIEAKTYCIGGPFHAPHVLAQNRLLANQFVDVGTFLNTGLYEVRGPQFNLQPEIKVHENAIASRVDLVIGTEPPSPIPDLRTGTACIHLENKSDVEVLVRLEQTTERNDAVTAAAASRNPLFQKLFPQEVVNPEGLVDVSNVYLLAIKHLSADELVDRVGEVQVREYWSDLQKHFPTDAVGCEIVECTYDSLLVSFNILDRLLESLSLIVATQSPAGIPIEACCIAINSGEIMLGSQANQPAAFGKTLRNTKQMLNDASPRSVVLASQLYESIVKSKSTPSQSTLNQFEKTGTLESTGLVQLNW